MELKRLGSLLEQSIADRKLQHLEFLKKLDGLRVEISLDPIQLDQLGEIVAKAARFATRAELAKQRRKARKIPQ